MGFSSTDDLISEITSGKFSSFSWNKVTGAGAYTAGRWYDFAPRAGSPLGVAYSGTNLEWRTCDDTFGAQIGIPHGGNVSPDTKHVLNVFANVGGTTGVPSQLLLVDLQGYWPGINMNSSSPQTLTGTPSLRYTNGAGCRLYTVTTVATGAAVHGISLSYTNQNGDTGRTLPVSVSMVSSSIVDHIGHTGTGSGNYGPFLPLADGDTGVRNVASVTISTASGAGTAALCLARPLLSIPLVTVSVASERDLLNQLPSLPRVYDGACLVWLYYAGAATAAGTNFYGTLDFGWG